MIKIAFKRILYLPLARMFYKAKKFSLESRRPGRVLKKVIDKMCNGEDHQNEYLINPRAIGLYLYISTMIAPLSVLYGSQEHQSVTTACSFVVSFLRQTRTPGSMLMVAGVYHHPLETNPIYS